MSLSVKVNGKTVYVTPTGLKLTARGKVQPVREVFASLPKSERRRVRKALRAAGFAGHAAAR